MKAVCNASPLITLAKAGLVELLHSLFDRVVVTQAVVKEVQAGGVEDPGSLAIAQLPWLEHVVLDPPTSRLSVIHLGAGEAETIEWSLRHPEYTALLDDRAARRTAEALGVRCAGTLRVLFEASRRNLVVSFPEAVIRIRTAGLYCDQRMIDIVSRNR